MRWWRWWGEYLDMEMRIYENMVPLGVQRICISRWSAHGTEFFTVGDVKEMEIIYGRERIGKW